MIKSKEVIRRKTGKVKNLLQGMTHVLVEKHPFSFA